MRQCGRCKNDATTVARGKVELLRCGVCKTYTICCPHCGGQMRDLAPMFVQQKCQTCNYVTNF